ncbi:hypothetical protein AB205_0200810 [Aquarana catesbeiana]|uniref:Uncharacterized protein n=1 Tax=Aquarana catesbeiana TaxID=8400 RepID=A0A2G9QJA5_AQUCT|nr:hypothetical protein AB205_0200810 [Aquarana catesbeiana]PIO15647.1 hypothetical protein AB205_0200810 [Aquarana catesbeiana]
MMPIHHFTILETSQCLLNRQTVYTSRLMCQVQFWCRCYRTAGLQPYQTMMAILGGIWL